MIIVLDDNPNRHRSFARYLVGHRVKHVHTAAEALGAIDTLRPRLIFLDYNLDEFGTPIEESGTGMDVATWLVAHERDLKPTPLIVVHSLNLAHGPQMAELLIEGGFPVVYHPFAWENEAFLDQMALRAGA